MLPFLKSKKEASVSAPVEAIERKPDDESAEYDYLEGAMEEFIDAVASKNVSAACESFRSMFAILESMPHEEGGE